MSVLSSGFKLLPVIGNYALGEPRSLAVLDNATIHHSDIIVDLVQDSGARIVYLPPYSPDLNPIELMFSLYKKSLKRECMSFDWWTAHCIALDSVGHESARNFFRHCDIHVQDDDKSQVPQTNLLCLLMIVIIQEEEEQHRSLLEYV